MLGGETVDYSFEKGKFTESELEKDNIELFQKQGYEYVHGVRLNRTADQILLSEDLRSFLKRNYEWASLTDRELELAVNTISRIPSTPLSEGNKRAFKLINEGFDLQRDDPSKVALHVQYIDFDNPENNIFKVINQYEVKGESNRVPDLLVFINGIPVAIWEFKTAIKEDTTVYDAWKQITIRYVRDIPNLLKYCFMAVVSDGANTRLGSIFTKYPYYYSWNKANEEEKVSNGISSLLTMIKGAFAKERILSILRDFIVYPDGQKTTPIICRYPQYFAATRMLDNIKLHMRPAGDGKGGTYFGATGCGKTYTMLYLTRLIMQRDPETFSNPTVILLEDREDLDTQTAELFITAKQFLGEEDVKSIESREDLIKTLKDKPSGGIYVMTIQKFSEEIGILSDRTNIICFSDEAHRTQTNLRVQPKQTKNGIEHRPGFAKIIRTSLPNATYCGFTGTPIDQTLAVFGPTVDTYTMKESCDDGITVRISYEPRLAKVLMSDREAQEINEYYHQCSDQGSSEQQVEASKRAMSKLKVILSNPDRMRKLALDMIGHYKKLCATKPNVVQKAMVVCADRQIAHNFVKLVLELQPEWSNPKKTEHEELLTKA